MLIIDRETFERAVSDADMELREDYSGRSMYGKTCPAVVTSASNVSALYIFLAVLGDEMVDAALMLAESERADSMGWDTVFYWPSLSLSE